MNIMRKKRKGYAITIEIIFTLSLIVMMVNTAVYTLVSYNTLRYMDTVLTSTAIQVAKWGGTSSNAYLANNMNYDAISNANRELNKAAAHMNPKITGGPSKVVKSDTVIWVQMDWKQPNFLGLPPISKSIRLEMESIMRPGNLL